MYDIYMRPRDIYIYIYMQALTYSYSGVAVEYICTMHVLCTSTKALVVTFFYFAQYYNIYTAISDNSLTK